MSYIPLHPQYADGKRNTLTFFEQMGNIGSEVSRAMRAKTAGRTENFQAAFWRMIELIDLTLADISKPKNRKKELRRCREVLCDFLIGENIYKSTTTSRDAYFTQFALVARSTR